MNFENVKIAFTDDTHVEIYNTSVDVHLQL